MPDWPTWVWWTISGVLGAGGMALLWWSLLADRSRGRRRCPKCWYDMSGTSGLRCSECGRQVRRERSLFRTRRRWRWIVPTTLVFVLSVSSSLIPRAKASGWPSIVPTSILIALFPHIEAQCELPGWRKDLIDELFQERFQLGALADDTVFPMWDWQWRVMICRALRQLERFESRTEDRRQRTPGDLRYQAFLCKAVEQGAAHRLGLVEAIDAVHPTRFWFDFPKTWPADAPVHFTASIAPGFIWTSMRLSITSPDDTTIYPSRAVTLPFMLMCGTGEPNYRGEVVLPASEGDVDVAVTANLSAHLAGSTWENPRVLPWTTLRHTARIRLDGSINDFVRPLNDPDLDRAIRSSFGWKLSRWRDDRFLVVSLPGVSASREDDVGDIARIEILLENRIVFTQAWAFTIGSVNLGDPYHLEVRLRINEFLRQYEHSLLADDDNRWTLRFRIDPVEIFTYHQGKSYWPGVIETPVDWKAAMTAEEKWD